MGLGIKSFVSGSSAIFPVSPVSISLNGGAAGGTDLGLVVFINYGCVPPNDFTAHPVTTNSVTWNGIALTQVGFAVTTVAGGQVETWVLVGPATGTHNLIINFTPSGATVAGIVVNFYSATGVEPTMPIGARGQLGVGFGPIANPVKLVSFSPGQPGSWMLFNSMINYRTAAASGPTLPKSLPSGTALTIDFNGGLPGSPSDPEFCLACHSTAWPSGDIEERCNAYVLASAEIAGVGVELVSKPAVAQGRGDTRFLNRDDSLLYLVSPDG